MSKHVTMDELRERSKSSWGTMGVVSALLAGLSVIPPMSAQSSVLGGDTTNAWGSPWLAALLYLSFAAFLCNMFVIVVSTIFYIFIDHCLTPEDVEAFLKTFNPIIQSFPAIFAFSIMLVLGELIAAVGYTTSTTKFWVIGGATLGVTVILIALACCVGAWIMTRCANHHLRAKLADARREALGKVH